MIMDTLRDLTLYILGNPPTFHLSLVEEFSTYVTWPRVYDQLKEGGGGGTTEYSKAETEEEYHIFRDI